MHRKKELRKDKNFKRDRERNKRKRNRQMKSDRT